jgi:chromosomal replication initiator protein
MDIASALVQRIGRDRFELWFGPHTKIEQVAGKVIVSATHQFYLDRLRKAFQDDIQAVCLTLCQEPTQVEFKVDINLENSGSESGQSGGFSSSEPQLKVAQTASRSASFSAQGSVGRSKKKATPAQFRTPVAVSRSSASSMGLQRRNPTLNEFVVGDGNRLAFTAAEQAVRDPGTASPLVIHGPAGCGKSHLLAAIADKVRRTGRLRRALYISAEEFTTQFLSALRGSGLPSFRHKYRELELLAIDDLQFFVGKKATYVELQQTIDHLLRRGGQLIVSADRSPKELTSLSPDLIGRLFGGLVCNMESADEPTRRQILDKLAVEKELVLPTDVLDLLAAQLPGDARQLGGALNRLRAAKAAFGKSVDVAFAQQVLGDLFRGSQRVLSISDVEKAVCNVFGIDTKSIQSSRKTKNVSQPRMLAMYLSRKFTRAALSEIGEHFGRRSHSTVISAHRKVSDWMSENQSLLLPQGDCNIAEAVRRVEAQLEQVG